MIEKLVRPNTLVFLIAPVFQPHVQRYMEAVAAHDAKIRDRKRRSKSLDPGVRLM
jgi:hypothetical protein